MDPPAVPGLQYSATGLAFEYYDPNAVDCGAFGAPGADADGAFVCTCSAGYTGASCSRCEAEVQSPRFRSIFRVCIGNVSLV